MSLSGESSLSKFMKETVLEAARHNNMLLC